MTVWQLLALLEYLLFCDSPDHTDGQSTSGFSLTLLVHALF